MTIEEACEQHPEILLCDGFDNAFVGVARRCGMEDVAVYDEEKIIQKLMEDDLTEEEAWEHFQFNIEGAYVGERTPMFMSAINPLGHYVELKK